METERTMEYWSIGDTRLSWSAVFAGWAVAMAAQLTLTLLGLAIGAWSIDLEDVEPVGGVPLGTGVWTGFSILVSAFIGGYVTARLSGSVLRHDGVYHGIVVWGINWLVFAWLTTTAMATLFGGVFAAFGSTLQSLGQGATSVVSAAASQLNGGSISMEDLQRQVESVLQATGKKELQPGEIKKDAERVTGSAESGQPIPQVADAAWIELQEKLASLDRDAAINVLTTKMGMAEPQARQVVQSTIGLLAPLKDKVQEVKAQSVDVGNQALNRLGTTAMWLAVLALITLAVSVFGGITGISTAPAIRTQSDHYRTEVRKAS